MTLAIRYIVHARCLPRVTTLALGGAIPLVEMVFLSSNLGKFSAGGFVPVLMAVQVALAMWV